MKATRFGSLVQYTSIETSGQTVVFGPGGPYAIIGTMQVRVDEADRFGSHDTSAERHAWMRRWCEAST